MNCNSVSFDVPSTRSYHFPPPPPLYTCASHLSPTPPPTITPTCTYAIIQCFLRCVAIKIAVVFNNVYMGLYHRETKLDGEPEELRKT